MDFAYDARTQELRENLLDFMDAEVYPAPVKHATQMKYADSRGARFVLTLDRDGTVSVKDLRSGERKETTLTPGARK